MVSQPEDLVNAAEAAALARVTTGTVRRWQRAGLLRHAGRTPGGRWLFRRADVVEMLQGAQARRDEEGAEIVRAQLSAFLERRTRGLT